MDIDHQLQLWNTLSKKKEGFVPIEPGYVKIYACGQTVYEDATIGNFRTYIFEDLLRRVLRYEGYKVNFVQNITDVGHLVGDGDMGEDKLTLSAKKHGANAWELAKAFEKDFFEDSLKLNILRPDISCRATEHIPDQIEKIKKLEGLEYTYKTNDGIYFDTSKLPDYGKLAHLDKEGLREGARVEINPEKRNITDFALWKFSPNLPAGGAKRQMEWESPWGKGFPGWHIECSAMSTKYLGVPFDIHCGGIDHIPIHHTNEIAQNEALYGIKTVNYWLHGGFLLVNQQKMSKSLNNFYTLSDIIKKDFDPLSFRYFTFTAHYRQPLNFTWPALEQADASYKKLIRTAAEMPTDIINTETIDDNKKNNENFLEAINDDLNMPKALAVVWEILKNKELSSSTKLKMLFKFDEVLGLSIKEKVDKLKEEIKNIPEKVLVLLKDRSLARKNKDWKKADEIRKEVANLGYEIKDLEEETTISAA